MNAGRDRTRRCLRECVGIPLLFGVVVLAFLVLGQVLGANA